ncbi:sorbosone dehydrogenase family protein [Brevundimonas diminuta]|jgi:glucose/arabinose dehydrogenase|uniref:Sorbosone dehydrogenase family protein n=1 Tax=Brevundimonas diminuta TaxID=293 RepID=A0A410NWZ1_BREDI|nr:PQQ-dependent sugar dehydrogenase [Brevundimonas diminuta]MBD3572721.1 sorbosone dehydrogenase family protein [Brevundimonas diminuta]QAT14386.1 sorbosone dehydrogenase family protein [Brevundimonas diminuta]QQB88238.1 sorbosone dehydrogenase family protein [Brevundimonas diminuta]GEC01274.1 sorbosone dehydrogenase [Brevundimonas diminuta]
MIRSNLLLYGALGGAVALAACGRSEKGINEVGPAPDLPEIRETLLPPMRIARPVGWGDETPRAPEGFVVTALATDLRIPRQMLVLPNGDILVAEGRGGGAPALRPKDVIAGVIKKQGNTKVEGGDRVTLLRDADNDGRAEVRTVFIDGLNAPYGLAHVDGRIYVAEQDALVSFPYVEGQTRIAASPEEVTRLPSALNHHWTKALTANADGSTLYVGIGSNSNAGERGMAVEEERAVVWAVDRATGARRTIARGIRNPTALAIEPSSAALWAVVNERDEIGPQLVPDYLTSVRDGAFYGWPYSYWGQNIDPRVRPQKPELVAAAVKPDYALGAHVAALGLSFARDGGFGGAFAEGAFIGQHGSWNRQDLAGYKVAWVPFSGGQPAGAPVDFLTGFLTDEGEARGRPVGVWFDPQRRILLVADDLSNTVWRVAPTGAAPGR